MPPSQPINTEALIVGMPRTANVIHARCINAVIVGEPTAHDGYRIIVHHSSRANGHIFHEIIPCENENDASKLRLQITQDWRAGLRVYARMLAVYTKQLGDFVAKLSRAGAVMEIVTSTHAYSIHDNMFEYSGALKDSP